jgi:Kef-type K+ transport system membrane component KefB
MVITCAAVDDITAWCLLAALVAFVKAGSFTSVVYIMLLTLTYVLLMLKVVRPVLHRVGQRLAARPNPGAALAVFFFLPLFLSAFVTEVIGIHALFGAFMAGAVMPQNVKLKNAFVGKVQDVSLVVLLPLFFALTGLRTRIGLLDQLHAWQLTGVIILVAVVGKFAGSAVAARLVGQTWRNSLMVGALMNTRGLMELVVLNIGYDLGILRPEVFSMMVIMALATTCMTGPVLSWIDTLFGKPEPVSSHLAVPEGASPARLG